MAGLADISSRVAGLSLRGKAALAAVLLLTIASVILTVSWLQKADYQVLYSQVSEEDGGLIIQRLKDLKVPYQVSAGTIMVPADKVYDLRLQLATQGLPQGGVIGYELFDKTGFTTTDFVQKLNYKRAMQGELARTIRSLSEIEQCRVHLVVPEKTLFPRPDERPKASVLLKLKAGRKLSPGQVQGIVHLVSSSVEGLNPRDVSVINNLGEMLTSPSSDGMAYTSSQLDYQRALEKEAEEGIAAILEPIVGRGKVRAKVSASVDFTKVEKTEEKFDPDGQIVRSEQKHVERSVSQPTGGVPGVSSNMPGKGASSGAVQQPQTERKQEVVNYEITKITSRIVSHPGEIRRLSVAVLVDGQYVTAPGAKEKSYKPRAEEEVKKFEEMVKNAIGFNAERGDDVRVVNMPFEGVPQEELQEAPREIMPVILTVAKYFVPLMIFVVVLLFVIRPIMKMLAAAPRGTVPPVPLPRTVGELERSMEIAGPQKGELIGWSQKNPQEAAQIVKNWLEGK